METLSADVNFRLLMREGETRDEAMGRLTDLFWSELCQLADHHIDFWVEGCEIV